MDVQVKYGLSGLRPNVEYRPIAIFDGSLPRNLSRGKMAPSNGFEIIGRCFFQAGKVFLRNYQHVRGSLWIDIFEGKGVFVFVYFLGRNFTPNDATE